MTAKAIAENIGLLPRNSPGALPRVGTHWSSLTRCGACAADKAADCAQLRELAERRDQVAKRFEESVKAKGPAESRASGRRSARIRAAALNERLALQSTSRSRCRTLMIRSMS
jgi:hypothetical protein